MGRACAIVRSRRNYLVSCCLSCGMDWAVSCIKNEEEGQ